MFFLGGTWTYSSARESACLNWAECRHHKYQKHTLDLYSALTCGLIYSPNPNVWKNNECYKKLIVKTRRVHLEDEHTFEMLWIYCKCLGCPIDLTKKKVHFFFCLRDPVIHDDTQMSFQSSAEARLSCCDGLRSPPGHGNSLTNTAWSESDTDPRLLIATDCRYVHVFDRRHAGWSLSFISCVYLATNVHLNHSWKHFTLCPGHGCLV